MANEIANLIARIRGMADAIPTGLDLEDQEDLRDLCRTCEQLLAFWQKAREHIFDGISDDDCQEWAVEAGLLVRVAYDPAAHGDVEGAEPGDTICVDA